MKVFYHSDNDGKCAAYWVKTLNKLTDNFTDEYIKINYGMQFPFDSINKNEIVYIVDYSILPSEMDRLLKITNNVIWIDHHKSAIERYKNYDKDIKGLRYDGVAGCMLTFCFLSFMDNGDINFSLDMTENAPMFTKLIADYDVWTFKYGDDTRSFQKGIELYPHEPNDNGWAYISDNVDKIVDMGKTIIEYRKHFMADYCASNGFDTMLNGYKCFAINIGMIGSDDFVIDNADDYDILLGFSYNGERWNYSLRSTKVDCSKLAMEFGGGGHVGAAGFNSADFILKNNRR